MDDLITMEHNQAMQGAGTTQEVEELNKALSSGGPAYADTLPAARTGGTVFMTEDLEPTLKIVSEIDKHVKFFNMLPKSKAFQLVEEFDMQTKHGGMGTAWIEESDSEPREEDAQYDRELEIVKYMGVKKKVTHVMTEIRSGHGDVIAKETKNGVSYLLKNIEFACFNGAGFFNNSGAYDGAVALGNDWFAWSGLDRQLRAGFNNAERKQADFQGYEDDLSHILDLDEETIAPEDIEESCRIALEDFGAPDKFMIPYKAHSDFSRSYYPKERFNDGKGNIMPGTIVPRMMTCLGEIEMIGSKFLTPKSKPDSTSAQNSSCLGAPAGLAATDTNPANTDLEAGTYIYRVRCVNKHGEGDAATSAGFVAIAGDRINVGITDPAAGTPDAYAVYRSEKDGAATTCRFVGYVKRTGAVTQFIDLNNYKPGSAQAYLLQVDSDVMTLRQLTPMMKIDFAIIGLYRHWAQVFYGTPIVFKPNYCVILENIKQR